MRLVTYNVEYGEGINRRWKYLEVFKFFKIVGMTLLNIADYLKTVNPDILGLIEIDSGSVRYLKRSGSQLFAESLEMDYWVEKTKYARKSVYKVLNFVPIVRKQCNAILSKYQLHDTKFYFLSKGMKRLIIYSKIKMTAGFDTVNLHLFAVHLSLRKRTRAKQLKELGEIVGVCPSPKIVFGDFNVFKGLSELGTFLELSGTRNANETDEYSKTFPSWKPKHWIDHVFISPDILVKKYEVLDASFSDHLPVMIDFEIKNN
ncbi:MAG: endonuclease/exonuclease/phosphatase family protein [Nanoarchaeota archaeon]|nr:endonuclease/exonuclease/phosphatase family protein [DPANN group archaeon]MBL7116294.1 endonuclease/exonuclease/phosphatase family protein [Nanoarchaeota archaeon]